MASSSSYYRNNNNKTTINASGFERDPQLENTTLVMADPSDFRAVVQKLTGASTDPTVQNLSVTLSPYPSVGKYHSVQVGPVRPTYNLQERRQISSNLGLQLHQSGSSHAESAFAPGKRIMNVSPVSTLDMFLARGSPTTTVSPAHPSVQEELAIANKEFYLYPSPLGTSRKAEPELLPLFPTSSNS